MVAELAIRFVIGGLVVSIFAVIGDVLRPKSFAGIFGAAPSVALATLGLTFMLHGGQYVSTEGKSMIVGAVALLLYSALVGALLVKKVAGSIAVTGVSLFVWLAVAFGLWGLTLR